MTHRTGFLTADSARPSGSSEELTWSGRIRKREATWWIWLVISACLLCGMAGVDHARQLAMAISTAQAVVFLGISRNLVHFPTQVRVAYVIWMAASFVPELTFMYWIQTAGTTALILFGYCPLARMLLVFPWNRSVPLSWSRLRRIAFSAPVDGSIRTGLAL